MHRPRDYHQAGVARRMGLPLRVRALCLSCKPQPECHDTTDWSHLELKKLADKLAKEVDLERSQMLRLTLAEGKDFLAASEVQAISEMLLFDPVYATRSIVDVVPNPWLARKAIGDLLEELKQR